MDGLLTPVGDEAALTAALLRLINDDAEREALACAALKNSERFDPALIAERYEQLFERLAARRARLRWWCYLATGIEGAVASLLVRSPH